MANANGDSGNEAYCDDTEQEPKDLNSATLGFSTPEYAKRFAKASTACCGTLRRKSIVNLSRRF
jgi:hypothetical protein